MTLTSKEGQIVKVKVADERPHTSYYTFAIGTNSLTGTVFEIMPWKNVKMFDFEKAMTNFKKVR